jgi:hypothetical protein
MAPIPGFPMAMHHCNDENEVGLDGVKHGIGEDMCEAPSNIIVKNSPPRGIL